MNSSCGREWDHDPDTLPTFERLQADLDASAADIEVGRVVSGETVLNRLKDTIERYEADRDHRRG
jgi:hypothetical protein